MTGTLGSEPLPERRLHGWSWLFVLLQHLKPFIVPLIVVLLFDISGDPNERWNYIIVVAFMAVLITQSILRYFTFRYRIGDDGLTIRSGLLHRTRREIPFARIHNVNIRQSLLHRLFKVAEVQLESAGGQKAEAEMRVLSLDDALALENLIRHRTMHTPSKGAAESEETPVPAPVQTANRSILLYLPIPEIIRLGLISNRGTIVAAAALGLIWQIMPDAILTRIIENGMHDIAGHAGLHRPSAATIAITAILSIIALILLMRLLSVAFALTQYFGFTLSEERQRLTVDHGLLARIRSSAPRRRIQAWQMQEGLMHRLFRRRSLHVTIAVSQADESRAFNTLAPVATRTDCDRLIRHLLPQTHWPPRQWEKLPGIAWLRLFFRHVLRCVPIAALSIGFFGTPGAWVLVWLPLAAPFTYLHVRRLAYSVDDRLVAIRNGYWLRHWRFAEVDKIQALRLRRSPLDRCFGTSSLIFDTAGGNALKPPLQIRYLPQADAEALYDRLGRILSKRQMHW
ncbi:MAG: PH domain-containing protein [Xanthomonadaceae bacterium]|jgi:putative membrane protein|nr:PH domain-containing protein [Xanthomonadaceae bacterium]